MCVDGKGCFMTHVSKEGVRYFFFHSNLFDILTDTPVRRTHKETIYLDIVQ